MENYCRHEATCVVQDHKQFLEDTKFQAIIVVGLVASCTSVNFLIGDVIAHLHFVSLKVPAFGTVSDGKSINQSMKQASTFIRRPLLEIWHARSNSQVLGLTNSNVHDQCQRYVDETANCFKHSEQILGNCDVQIELFGLVVQWDYDDRRNAVLP